MTKSSNEPSYHDAWPSMNCKDMYTWSKVEMIIAAVSNHRQVRQGPCQSIPGQGLDIYTRSLIERL